MVSIHRKPAWNHLGTTESLRNYFFSRFWHVWTADTRLSVFIWKAFDQIWIVSLVYQLEFRQLRISCQPSFSPPAAAKWGSLCVPSSEAAQTARPHSSPFSPTSLCTCNSTSPAKFVRSKNLAFSWPAFASSQLPRMLHVPGEPPQSCTPPPSLLHLPRFCCLPALLADHPVNPSPACHF